jgi:hypothetical protein
MVLWDELPCRQIDRYTYFGGICCLHLQGRKSLFCSEYEGNWFLTNVGTYVMNYIMSHPRRLIVIFTSMRTSNPYKVICKKLDVETTDWTLAAWSGKGNMFLFVILGSTLHCHMLWMGYFYKDFLVSCATYLIASHFRRIKSGKHGCLFVK